MKIFYTIVVIAVMAFVGAAIGYNLNQPEQPFGGGTGLDYKIASSTTYTTAAGKASIVLAVNPGRGWAVIQNLTATVAYLALNATTTAAQLNGGLADKEFVIPVAASGGTYTFADTNRYIGQVIASSSAAVTLRMLEVY